MVWRNSSQAGSQLAVNFDAAADSVLGPWSCPSIAKLLSWSAPASTVLSSQSILPKSPLSPKRLRKTLLSSQLSYKYIHPQLLIEPLAKPLLLRQASERCALNHRFSENNELILQKHCRTGCISTNGRQHHHSASSGGGEFSNSVSAEFVSGSVVDIKSGTSTPPASKKTPLSKNPIKSLAASEGSARKRKDSKSKSGTQDTLVEKVTDKNDSNNPTCVDDKLNRVSIKKKEAFVNNQDKAWETLDLSEGTTNKLIRTDTVIEQQVDQSVTEISFSSCKIDEDNGNVIKNKINSARQEEKGIPSQTSNIDEIKCEVNTETISPKHVSQEIVLDKIDSQENLKGVSYM